ncbi:MAG: S9 family peptidase [Terriglobales bacterium]
MKCICPLMLASLLLAPLTVAQSAPQKLLTIESAFAEGGITGRRPESIQWAPNNSTLSFIQRDDSGDHGELWIVDAATGQNNLLVSETKLAKLSPPLNRLKDDRERERITRYHVEPYLWAPDSKHLIFNSLGQLWLYTIANGTAVLLSGSPDPAGDPKFSPNGNKLAYLRKHNLYVRHLTDPGNAPEVQLTHTSEKEEKDETLLNGEVDWVYAEELSVRSNYFWSPDGHDIVFLQMDESKVPAYPIVNWMPTHPTVDMEKYPKAGDPNPVVRLGVVSASGGKPKWISLTKDSDIYIPRFGWVRDGLLWAQVLNRAQDTLDLYFVDTQSGRSHKVLTETAPDAWVYVNDDFKVLKSGDRFLWSSWRDGTTQLYLYSFDKEKPLASDARLERQLTKGDFEMLGVQGLDETAGLVYFLCNKDDPRQRQLYSVRLDGSGLQRVSREEGTHAAIFADDGKHYFDMFSAFMTPPRLSACSSAGVCNQVWNSRNVDAYGLTPPQFLEFKANDGTTLYGELLLPSAVADTAKIPLIVNIYGGPAAQLVQNTWIQDWSGSSGLFHQILARQGFAIFTVDNRGTPARNRKFQAAVRHQFGAIELEDQLAALDQLFAQYPQLDHTRVGIWGWSNGGSMTLYAMTHSDVFKAGAAVSPVTTWRNYDSIYTERSNGLPTDKTSTSYTDLDLAKVAGKLHGSLLLLHGTSDDNVHFQNSIQMVEALVEAGKQFRFMAYPSKTHSIAGATDQTHLFHLIEDHFLRELK